MSQRSPIFLLSPLHIPHRPSRVHQAKLRKSSKSWFLRSFALLKNIYISSQPQKSSWERERKGMKPWYHQSACIYPSICTYIHTCIHFSVCVYVWIWRVVFFFFFGFLVEIIGWFTERGNHPWQFHASLSLSLILKLMRFLRFAVIVMPAYNGFCGLQRVPRYVLFNPLSWGGWKG